MLGFDKANVFCQVFHRSHFTISIVCEYVYCRFLKMTEFSFEWHHNRIALGGFFYLLHLNDSKRLIDLLWRAVWCLCFGLFMGPERKNLAISSMLENPETRKGTLTFKIAGLWSIYNVFVFAEVFQNVKRNFYIESKLSALPIKQYRRNIRFTQIGFVI